MTNLHKAFLHALDLSKLCTVLQQHTSRYVCFYCFEYRFPDHISPYLWECAVELSLFPRVSNVSVYRKNIPQPGRLVCFLFFDEDL